MKPTYEELKAEVDNAKNQQKLFLIAAFKAGFYKAKSVYKCELGQCKTDLEEWAAEHADLQGENQ